MYRKVQPVKYLAVQSAQSCKAVDKFAPRIRAWSRDLCTIEDCRMEALGTILTCSCYER